MASLSSVMTKPTCSRASRASAVTGTATTTAYPTAGTRRRHRLGAAVDGVGGLSATRTTRAFGRMRVVRPCCSPMGSPSIWVSMASAPVVARIAVEVSRTICRCPRRCRLARSAATAPQPKAPLGARMTPSRMPSSSFASGISSTLPCRLPQLPTMTLRACWICGSPPPEDTCDHEPAGEHPADPREDVGGPAEDALDLLVGLGHDLGVDADAGHDEEDLLVVAARVVGARRVVALERLGRLGVGEQPHQPDVDPPVLAGEDDLEGVLDLLDRAGRGCGRAGCRYRRGAGPIGVSVPTSVVATARTVPSPPSGQTMSTPRSSASLRLSDARVLLGRLDEDRLAPAVVGADLGDLLLDVGEVVELDGVDDDAETA